MIETEKISKEKIWAALAKVKDPEIPVLSLINLGMITGIESNDEKNQVSISMLPTFTACPAIKIMQDNIREQMHELGFENVIVNIDKSQSWNSNRITEQGKKLLNEFGLGSPKAHDGNISIEQIENTSCPHCGSENTTLRSLFGSTLCRSQHYCYDCKQLFERFKPVS
jgi:ring-1,2-phenylacetyl-CoA epoxidase subunit PaaD